MTDRCLVKITVNGTVYERHVEPRMHLADFLRHEINLTGTHIGCEHGVCGACTVLVDGASARSCLMLAVQAQGRTVETIESVAAANGTLDPIQAALAKHHGLQCGYCTPGFVMTMIEMRREGAERRWTEEEIRSSLSGNLCRCTGYHGIVAAALDIFGHPSDATGEKK
jgi:aerobic-type carbon monoxide dehydrogenase small subunit (CoxS/CutS family)